MGVTRLVLSAVLVAAPALAEQPPASEKVELEYDKGVDFASYKTFGWAPFQEAVPDAANHVRIQHAVERELLAKGLTQASSLEADLVVEYHARLEKKTRGTPKTEASHWQPSSPKFIVNIDRLEMGTLVLDLWDAHRRDVVWHAKTSEPLEAADAREKQISGIVKKLLNHYPPTPEPPR